MLEINVLLDILREWSFWDHAPPRGILRHQLGNPITLSPDLVLVIQGVRRCGKSTLLTQLMTTLRLDPQQCTFVNFEDPRLSHDLTHELLDVIVTAAKARRPGTQRHYFFFDEIQEVDNWPKWLHRKVDRPGQDCYVITGSNAALLSGELATALTGRHKTLELFPFDYGEYKALRTDQTIEAYLKDGGFPRALQEDHPEELLREYFTDIIERDVRRHVSVRSSTGLARLVKAVFEATGSEISQRSLAGMLGITTDTVGTHLWACEAAYMILSCPFFTYSERQRTARNRKYYPIDVGLRNAVATKTGLDRGKSLETIVFHHLRKHYREVNYWRGTGEVDFVTSGPEGIIPYQVSWEGIKERHRSALQEFSMAFPQAQPPIVVTRETIEAFLTQTPGDRSADRPAR